jgi:thiol-disulfide isomerase/thioredoxin
MLIAAVIGTLSPSAAWAQAAPAGQSPRSPEEIQKELFAVRGTMVDLMPAPEVLLDEARRNELRPKLVPLMRRQSDLAGELADALPETKPGAKAFQAAMRALLALLDDKQAKDELAQLTVSKDPVESSTAASWSIAIRWIKSRKNASAQEKMALELSEIARAHPKNTMIAEAAGFMADASATPALAEQIEQLLTKDLETELARETAQRLAARRKLNALEGKPLVVDAVTLDSTRFSSAAWKGKVVLVDFWATWCPPCVAELPKLKKVYAELHDKGLEIVGVSCDNDIEKLRGFLAKNPEMTWPQLFEPSRTTVMHSLADQYGVAGLPSMFLIDRKGIVRSIKAREEYEQLIPKLLEEKP